MPAPTHRSAFERWRTQGEGFSPLFSEPLLECALSHLEPALAAGATVIDLGSGPGHMAGMFAAMGARALAIDVDLAGLSTGRARHPGPACVAADQAGLPIRTASVDAVFSFSTLQYSDRDAVIAECRRVLKPGGRIAVVENLAGNPLARLSRALRAATWTRYPAHQEPRRHLRWRERTTYERAFGSVRFDAFHVLAPILLAAPRMHREPVARAGDTGARGLYALLARWDRGLARRWPALAWFVVVRGVR